MNSLSHKNSSDPQLPLNQEKRHLCTIVAVAWRQAPHRQAVHQFWKFPDFCIAPTRLQTSPKPHNFTCRKSLIRLYLLHKFSLILDLPIFQP